MRAFGGANTPQESSAHSNHGWKAQLSRHTAVKEIGSAGCGTRVFLPHNKHTCFSLHGFRCMV